MPSFNVPQAGIALPQQSAVAGQAAEVPMLQVNAQQGEIAMPQIGSNDTRLKDSVEANTFNALLKLGESILAPKAQQAALTEYYRGAERAGQAGGYEEVMAEEGGVITNIFGPSASARGAMAAKASNEVLKVAAQVEMDIPRMVEAGEQLAPTIAKFSKELMTGDEATDNMIRQGLTERTADLGKTYAIHKMKRDQEVTRAAVRDNRVLLGADLNGKASKSFTGGATKEQAGAAQDSFIASLERVPGELPSAHSESLAETYVALTHGNNFHTLNAMDALQDDIDPEKWKTIVSAREAQERDFIADSRWDGNQPWRNRYWGIMQMAGTGGDDEKIVALADQLNADYSAAYGTREPFLDGADIIALRKGALSERMQAARDAASRAREDQKENFKLQMLDRAANLAMVSGNAGEASAAAGVDLQDVHRKVWYGWGKNKGLNTMMNSSDDRDAAVVAGYLVNSVKYGSLNTQLKDSLLASTMQGVSEVPSGQFLRAYGVYKALTFPTTLPDGTVVPAAGGPNKGGQGAFAAYTSADTALKMDEFHNAVLSMGDPQLAYKAIFVDGYNKPVRNGNETLATTIIADKFPGWWNSTFNLEGEGTMQLGARAKEVVAQHLANIGVTSDTFEVHTSAFMRRTEQFADQIVVHPNQQDTPLVQYLGTTQGKLNLSYQAFLDSAIKQGFLPKRGATEISDDRYMIFPDRSVGYYIVDSETKATYKFSKKQFKEFHDKWEKTKWERPNDKLDKERMTLKQQRDAQRADLIKQLKAQ